jgi:hypothetical protein
MTFLACAPRPDLDAERAAISAVDTWTPRGP